MISWQTRVRTPSCILYIHVFYSMVISPHTGCYVRLATGTGLPSQRGRGRTPGHLMEVAEIMNHGKPYSNHEDWGEANLSQRRAVAKSDWKVKDKAWRAGDGSGTNQFEMLVVNRFWMTKAGQILGVSPYSRGDVMVTGHQDRSPAMRALGRLMCLCAFEASLSCCMSFCLNKQTAWDNKEHWV